MIYFVDRKHYSCERRIIIKRTKFVIIVIPLFISLLVIAFIINQTSLLCDHGCFNKQRITLFEELKDSCNNSTETLELDSFDMAKKENFQTHFTARLYRSNGGATTDFGFTITVQLIGEAETEILSSYGHPFIYRLECNNNGLIVIAGEKKINLSIEQITEMAKYPVRNYEEILK